MKLIVSFGILCLSGTALAQIPDFGPNVNVFSPDTPVSLMQQEIDKVYAIEQHSEFGSDRHAFLFLPGDYHVDIPIGFYTEVAGLGQTPDATHLIGNIHVDAAARNNNATTTFWRSAENFAVTPEGGTMRWAVSQAVPMRRLHVLGNLVLHQNGWASGGWMSDTLVDGTVDSGPQQQWISRNSEWKNWTGSNWNMVFVGVPQAPAGEWPERTFTKVEKTPLELEKPYIVAPDAQHWSIVVPQLQRDTSGTSWSHNVRAPARTIPFRNVYLAHPGRDTAETLNTQLAKGMNILFVPGLYELDEPVRVSRPNTVLMGLGFATLKPVHGTAAIETSDADGIVLTGLLIDAGEKQSTVLVQVGPRGSTRDHHEHPIAIQDVFFRVGGAGVGKTRINLEINSSGTIVDHTWIWRADHGNGVGWDKNLSDNGIVVNGNDVTIYGLFVEHHEQFQVLWNGDGGRTYFYQSEIPYDPPNQAAYTSVRDVDGWASYKVADTVKKHEAWGLGVYSVFTYPDVFISHAIEVPQTPQVRLHHMITVCLLTHGGIRHIVDDAGDATQCAPHRVDPKLTEFPMPQTSK
ncbi:MAG TPA: coagulation factor 5/8 type domain-containing protein [Acidobacteriaceae bacterium]|nr:coagulation factor 5/8 type domain-containing protein [Acidobacteriaceae bacterium]